MRPTTGLARGLAAVALVAACGGARLSDAQLGERMTQLIAAGDTMALGRLAERQCRGLSGAEKQTCYEDYFVALSDSGRVRLALGALTALAGRDRRVEADGHVYTHVIGIRAWKPGMDVGKVFASCTGLFQSGCYHGVIQSYFTAQGGIDSTRVATLCDLIEGNTGNRWLRFQCVHGIGHGLEMVWNWDLPKALKGCDWLPTGWDRESCYGGAFMENAVASMPNGHHAPARVLAEEAERRDSSSTAADDHAGHEGHGEAAGHGAHGLDQSAITFKMRDPEDLRYPCTIVEPRYQASCYMLQGGMILTAVGSRVARAGEECNQAPAELRHQCWTSIGTMVSGIVVRDGRRAIRMCSEGEPGYRPWCYVGVVKNFIDVTADPDDGLDFCRMVPAGDDKRQCYVAVGEQVSMLHADRPAREAACARAHPEGREECRYGAYLLAEPPPGLPIVPGGLRR